MKKFNASVENQLIGLITYKIFKDRTCQDSYQIAKIIGLTETSKDNFDDEAPDAELKSWIELGSKVNFALIEENGDVNALLMSQFDFEMLRNNDKALHQKISPFRNKASSRWSNEWKQIQPRLQTAKSLSIAKLKIESLNLTWQSKLNACARLLEQVGKERLAKNIINLKFENLIDRNKHMLLDAENIISH